MMKRLSWLAVLGVAACGPYDPSGRAAGVAALTADGTKGATLYMGQCASCHASDGKGVASTGGADLTAIVGQRTTFQLASIVLNGEGKMAPLPGMKDQEIADTVAYVKATFGK
ncbi:MAG: c-type cytochrome [Archangium sp.]